MSLQVDVSYNMCCIEGMKMMPDNSFDLAIVDPQTGQGEGKNHVSRPVRVKQDNGQFLEIKRKHRIKDWDDTAPSQEYFDELFRVSKHQIIMCENFLSFDQKSKSSGRIIWNLLRSNDFSDCQIMWTSLFNKIEYFEYMWNGMIQGEKINSRRQIGDKSLNEKRIHPGQKPVIVYKYLLRKYASAGWKILDTHRGSGSLDIACLDLGFHYISFEKDVDLFNDANRRINIFKNQIRLFA